MKIIPLRLLIREPSKVKRLTRAGHKVQVTDQGKPLWIITAAPWNAAAEEARRRAVDAILDKVLLEPPSPISAAKLLEESRR